MKKLLLFVFAALAFAACTQDVVVDITPAPIVDEAPETLVVGFEGDDTRIQLNEAQKTVWTKGDQVSVFYLSDANQKWQYDGETGSRTAELKRVNAGTATTSTTGVVIVYPYNTNYYINTRTLNVKASLPAVQHYLANSYGLDGNIMISQSEYNQGSLKNICGWLKLQLTGNGEIVKSITFKGKDGEQVAGELYINSADATAILASDMGDIAEDDGENATGGTGANLVFDDTILTEVTLDCGEGVTLGAEATSFYLALPPQTFENGFKVEVLCDDDTMMVKSSSNTLTIERNHIQPMAAMEFTPSVPNNQIWYTSTDVVEPNNIDAFGATIISNEWDSETGKGIITFDGNVTMVGNKAFYECDNFITINLPDSVTTIGEEAFYACYSLTSVNIPDSVTTIGNYAFFWCTSLTSVNIPESVTTIGEEAFSGCTSLTSVDIPESVTTIGWGAFSDCYSLTSVNIPESVTTIGNDAFSHCTSLTSVNIPDSVTTIGNYAFEDCDSLTSVNIPESVTTIGEGAFYSCSNLTSVNIPDSVTTIGNYAFFYCKSLTSVTIGNSVTTIGNNAFYHCDSLTSVNIPDSVTTIGDYAFDSCYILTSVTIGNSVTTIGEFAFIDCTSLTSVNIPESVTSIGKGAFAICSNLKEFTGKYAADGGRCLIIDNTIIAYAEASGTTYNIPDSVTTIGNGAFSRCYSLTSVNIPDSVTTIGNDAFSHCISLTSVNIPDGVTTIGEFAFVWCNSLKYVYCKATTPPALGGSYVFNGNAAGRKIYVPTGSGEAYKTATYWREYANDIIEYEF